MKNNKKRNSVGVIVGRFQTHILHKGHRDLIDHVRNECHKTIIVLGLSPLKTTYRNPLDFQARKILLEETYPDITVLYHSDQPTDEKWSKELDKLIEYHNPPEGNVVLYGARDSFINYYHGKFPTSVLEAEVYYSATEERRNIGLSIPKDVNFRAGVIWATQNQYPTCYCTVDAVIWDSPDKKKILLGRKLKEDKYRFIGGFASSDSPTYEADVRREVMEEAGIEVDGIKYLGSFLVDDWRYRKEKSKIKTLLFECYYQFGKVKADDDIAEVRWFDFDDVTVDDVVPEHHPLLNHIKNS